ncbi:MAG TPA: OmpA family protein [Casimicrobiaceae bacterium]|jgi:outer membrane protein OmpA-like peptidoglycan-associated protein
MIEPREWVFRSAALMLACAVLAACVSKGVVVLLPDKDGHPSAVAVKEGDREIVLDRPYAAAKVTPLGPRAYASSAQEVETQFGAALAAQPSRAETFILYFVEGKDELTEESKLDVDKILAEIARRPVPDVLVVGHTDLVGSDPFNDALGQQRAETVRAALMRLGVAAENVRAISRGKRAPVIATSESEPRNRRVEILVR